MYKMLRRFCSAAGRTFKVGDILTFEEAKAGVLGTAANDKEYIFKVLETHTITEYEQAYTKYFDGSKIHYVLTSFCDVVAKLLDCHHVYQVDTTKWVAIDEVVFGMARRNKKGQLLNGYIGSLGKERNGFVSDLRSVIATLIQAKKNEDEYVAILQDNKNIVDMINRQDLSKVPVKYREMVKVINTMRRFFKDVTVYHSYRCANRVSHHLCSTPIQGISVTKQVTTLGSHV